MKKRLTAMKGLVLLLFVNQDPNITAKITKKGIMKFYRRAALLNLIALILRYLPNFFIPS